jgi:hypothetical protein
MLQRAGASRLELLSGGHGLSKKTRGEEAGRGERGNRPGWRHFTENARSTGQVEVELPLFANTLSNGSYVRVTDQLPGRATLGRVVVVNP